MIHSDNDFATVAFLRIRRASLEAKREQEIDIAVPALLDPPYFQVAEYIQAELTNDGQSPGRAQPQIYSNRALDIELMAPSISRYLDNWISVGNIHRDLSDVSDMPLEDEVRECFYILQSRDINQGRARRLADFGPKGCLSEHSLSFSHMANMNVFISSMEDFASINAVYATYFGVSPPARACVAVDLPHPLRVMFDCVAYTEQKRDDRKALHVQGLSYWAPANIGPYSQAIIVSLRIGLSGRPWAGAVDRLTYPNQGGRTHFHLRANWPRSQFPQLPVSPNSRHRNPTRIAAFRSRRESAVKPSRWRRPTRKGLGRRRRSRADDPILGYGRTPHLILNNGRTTLRRE